MSHRRFDQEWAFRGSEWARWLRLGRAFCSEMVSYRTGTAKLLHLVCNRLPADERTLHFLVDETALKVHGHAMEVVGYEGNCTCVGAPTSCTIPRDYFPIACVAKWRVGLGESVAIALINLGENITQVSIRIADFGSGKYDVTEVWLKERLGERR